MRPVGSVLTLITLLAATAASALPLTTPAGLTVTRFGGLGDETTHAIAAFPGGGYVIAGVTSSTLLPGTAGRFQPTSGGRQDAFVARFDANDALVWSTFLGGSGDDEAFGVGVAPDGDIVVAGITTSPDFPGAPGGTTVDGFVTRLGADGAVLLSATRIGGSGPDYLFDLALDREGSAWVSGTTSSTDGPALTSGPAPTAKGGYDIILARVLADGSVSDIVRVGGSADEAAHDVAVDAEGAAYATGYTFSADFPTTPGALRPPQRGFFKAFVVKVRAGGTEPTYAALLGGSGWEQGSGIGVDASGRAVVVGSTASYDFPVTPGAFQSALRDPNADAFVAILSAAGDRVEAATLLGGYSAAQATPPSLSPFLFPLSLVSDGRDWAFTVDLLPDGRIAVGGLTLALDFPTTPQAPQRIPGGGIDAFLTVLSPGLDALVLSTYLGGPGSEYGEGVYADGATLRLAGGSTSPAWLAPSAPSPQLGAKDGFVVTLEMGTV